VVGAINLIAQPVRVNRPYLSTHIKTRIKEESGSCLISGYVEMHKKLRATNERSRCSVLLDKATFRLILKLLTFGVYASATAETDAL
jgi:hypothetical protein